MAASSRGLTLLTGSGSLDGGGYQLLLTLSLSNLSIPATAQYFDRVIEMPGRA